MRCGDPFAEPAKTNVEDLALDTVGARDVLSEHELMRPQDETMMSAEERSAVIER